MDKLARMHHIIGVKNPIGARIVCAVGVLLGAALFVAGVKG